MGCHGRSTSWGETCDAEASWTKYSWGETCATQQPNKVVGTISRGARHPIKNTPTTLAPGHSYDEVKLLGSLEIRSTDPKMMANIQHYGALTAKLGARHPITTPTTKVTNHSTWPDHMTGLVGWWRRVKRDGEKEGM